MPARKSAPKPKKPKTKPTAAPHIPSEGSGKPARRKAQATPAKKAPAKKAAPARKPRGAAASKASAKPAPKSKPAPKAKPAAPPVPSVAAQLLARKGAPDAPQREKPLTNLEEAFITEYMRNGSNGTAAYIFVHPGMAPHVAAVYAHRTLRKSKVAERIAQARETLALKHDLTRDKLVARWAAIAMADANELTQMRAVACGHCWGGAVPQGKGQWTDPDPECENCGGEGQAVPWIADTRKLSPEARALYAGIKVTKEGVQVLTHDQANALVQVGKILGHYEKDNEQKGKGAAEAIKEFFSAVQGARLPIVKPGIVKS